MLCKLNCVFSLRILDFYKSFLALCKTVCLFACFFKFKRMGNLNTRFYRPVVLCVLNEKRLMIENEIGSHVT